MLARLEHITLALVALISVARGQHAMATLGALVLCLHFSALGGTCQLGGLLLLDLFDGRRGTLPLQLADVLDIKAWFLVDFALCS